MLTNQFFYFKVNSKVTTCQLTLSDFNRCFFLSVFPMAFEPLVYFIESSFFKVDCNKTLLEKGLNGGRIGGASLIVDFLLSVALPALAVEDDYKIN